LKVQKDPCEVAQEVLKRKQHFFILKEFFTCFPFWQASQIWSFSNLSFGSSCECEQFFYAKAKTHHAWIEENQLNKVKRYLEDKHY